MEVRCKLCGGRLKFEEGSFSAPCEFCGTSQFIFDYLDKESEDYDEQVELIKQEKENFETTYFEYADDILNVDSYCLTSEDFKKIIHFFEKCGDYKDAPTLLLQAKKYFITKVSSFDDCVIANGYLKEMNDLSEEEKSAYEQQIVDMSFSYTIVDLVKRGFVALPPEETSGGKFLELCHKLLEQSARDTDVLEAYEKEAVVYCLNRCVDYIEKNCAHAIENSSDVEALYEIQKLLPMLRQTFAQIRLSGVDEVLDKKISDLDEQRKSLEEERLAKVNVENRRKRIKRIGVFAVVFCIIVSLIGFIAYKVDGYSSKHVNIEVLSKSNIDYNETLADGYIGSGYFYLFEFQITNQSPNDIEMISGDFEIINKDGRTLSSSFLELHCELSAESTSVYDIQLNVKKGHEAVELWNTDLEELTIKFRIKKIEFADGIRRNYDDAKNKIIYP